MDRGAWQAIYSPWGHKELVTTEQLTHAGEKGFPSSSAVENLTANAGDVGFISGLGRTPGGGHGIPL